MVKFYKNKNGYAYCICEYSVVNGENQPDHRGHYLYVDYLWINRKKKSKRLISRLIYDILNKNRSVKHVYWKRFKYTLDNGKERVSTFDVDRSDGNIKLVKHANFKYA